MANMENLGQNIAWLGKAMAPHKDSFPKIKESCDEGEQPASENGPWNC